MISLYDIDLEIQSFWFQIKLGDENEIIIRTPFIDDSSASSQAHLRSLSSFSFLDEESFRAEEIPYLKFAVMVFSFNQMEIIIFSKKRFSFPSDIDFDIFSA